MLMMMMMMMMMMMKRKKTTTTTKKKTKDEASYSHIEVGYTSEERKNLVTKAVCFYFIQKKAF